MPVVVFLCVANSARSQMAEGLARSMAPPGWTFYSAGSAPGRIKPLAIEALAEVGIDISRQRSKGLAAVPLTEAAAVVTLCAEEVCPVVPPGVRRLHWPIPDPVDLPSFREARDRLRALLPTLWEETGQRER